MPPPRPPEEGGGVGEGMELAGEGGGRGVEGVVDEDAAGEDLQEDGLVHDIQRREGPRGRPSTGGHCGPCSRERGWGSCRRGTMGDGVLKGGGTWGWVRGGGSQDGREGGGWRGWTQPFG